jgi:hypothetical protein
VNSPDLGGQPHPACTPPPDHDADTGAACNRDQPQPCDVDPIVDVHGALTVVAPTDPPAITPLAAGALLRILLTAAQMRGLRAPSTNPSPLQPEE